MTNSSKEKDMLMIKGRDIRRILQLCLQVYLKNWGKQVLLDFQWIIGKWTETRQKIDLDITVLLTKEHMNQEKDHPIIEITRVLMQQDQLLQIGFIQLHGCIMIWARNIPIMVDLKWKRIWWEIQWIPLINLDIEQLQSNHQKQTEKT